MNSKDTSLPGFRNGRTAASVDAFGGGGGGEGSHSPTFGAGGSNSPSASLRRFRVKAKANGEGEGGGGGGSRGATNGRRISMSRRRLASSGRVVGRQFSICRNGALALALGLLLSSGGWTAPALLLNNDDGGHSKGSGVGMRMAHAFTVERRRDAHNIKRIVFGTAALSKSSDPSALLDAAYSKGYRRFDLAHTYGGGQSEILFGRWLESRSGTIDRGELNIITKGGIGDDAFGDPDRPLLTRRGLREEVDESLHALRVDRVDLYMYHRDDVRLSVEQFVDWINDVGVSTGKVERWGVSNWTFERFKAAHSYAKAKGLVPPSTNSPQYSLANPSDGEIWPSTYSISGQDKEEEIDWYQDRGVELLCWEVLAKGFMAKADLWPEHEVDPASLDAPVERGSDEWRLQRMQRAYCHAENYRRRHLAVRLADLTGVNLAQIAMLYPLTRGRHISVIFGSSKVDHLDDMVALQHMNIDDEAMMLLAGHREVMMTDADADADKEEEGFAFLPRMMGLGRNRIRPIQLTAKAREAKIAAEKKVAERMPVAFTATSTSSSARGIGRSS
eukprot:CAMPEP_0113573960 /NCGR_PEP_ID=MMETSP0015_2-20120614/26895_1 /TAXON_ID=2838 /ORGANISM="Odontella" /LENGTH=559 /DNA_ID=CAMNT_0000477071 /DNA_START=129 /DNA_END=1808 /DNA_ORIENTATION=+ /assembly_acc=CAM_ASM_000160